MSTPRWQPIVVGVDTSPAAAEAVRVGWAIADRAGAACRLVHATPEAWTLPNTSYVGAGQPEMLNDAVREAARTAVQETLTGEVPDAALDALDIRTGRGVTVLRDVAHQIQAGLVVLGGKHHTLLGRWVTGSTAHALLRSLDVPLLVTAHTPLPIRRVLVALDLSDAAGPTIRMAERLAAVFGAKLHAFHTVEPLPIIPDTPLQFSDEEIYQRSEEHLARYVWPLIAYTGATRSVRRGNAVESVAADVAERNADIVVLGSHGKGWVDRILIGSVTERVLSALPCSILVVPVMGPQRPATP
jgi:nucleotide-binding universal stress UspA family protein